MAQVKIVKRAFKEMQKLYHEDLETVRNIIKGFSEDLPGDCKQLEGYGNLCRTRQNDIRVIWRRDENNDFLVVKVGRRDKVYQQINRNRNLDNPLAWSDILDLPEDRVESIPTYKVSDQNYSSWYQFVYGGYLYSPILTPEQHRTIYSHLNTLTKNLRERRDEIIPSLLLQSAPGTGKTVCAALFACNQYTQPQQGWNIILILPPALCEEVKQFTCIKELDLKDDQFFFVGTFQEWHRSVNSELHNQVATNEEELDALTKEARRIHVISNNEYLSDHDLTLYRSFVYERDSINVKNPIYRNNELRVKKLIKIKQGREGYNKHLNNKLVWLDALRKTTQELDLTDIMTPEQITRQTLFIFDEAQDYLLRELDDVIQMLSRWRNQFLPPIIWLLGDLNQRIKPVDFDWGSLHLNQRIHLKYNYRNTQKILEFAEILHNFAKSANAGGRHLPDPSNPENAFEIGEKVAILKVDSMDDARNFLQQLSDNISASTQQDDRYLLRKLSRQVHLIYKHNHELMANYLPGISYLKAEEAKGREFDACIGFLIFQGEGKPSFEEANIWYTIATRAKSRLLIIATPGELERLGERDQFTNCDWYTSMDGNFLISWISELSGAEDLSEDVDAVDRLINDAVNSDPPLIHWDMYTVLRTAADDRINEIESKLIARLSQCNPDFLDRELKQADNNITDFYNRIAIKCLLLRSSRRFWDAITQANELKRTMANAYNRIINAIAQDLEDRFLPYEAARVRMNLGQQFPADYPFSSLISNNNFHNLSPVSNLCQMAIESISESELLLESLDEIQAAYNDYQVGNFITFDEYKSQRLH